jgi:hypothetical protein
MSSEELPYTYAYKPRLMGASYEFALSQDGMDWAIGPRTGRVSYPMIKHIRLGYKPTNMGTAQFMAEVWPLNDTKLLLNSQSARSMIDMADQGKEYTRFIQELHRRVAASQSNCVFEAGFPAWRWWPSAIFGAAIPLALIYVVVKALMASEYLVAGAITLLGAWFIWQIWNIVMRNRPRQYDPHNLPSDVLPKV